MLSTPKNYETFIWYDKSKLEKPAFITRTNQELIQKCKEIGCYQSIEDRVQEVTPNPPETFSEKIYLLMRLGENNLFGNYLIKDIQTYAKQYISNGNSNVRFSNGEIRIFDDITLISDKDITKTKLFFTAPNGIAKQNIEKGTYLIRNIKHYQKHTENGKPGKYDPTEGMVASYYLEDYCVVGSNGGKLHLCDTYLKDLSPHNFYIFCFHDEIITNAAQSKFGSNTYQIIDIKEWIKRIYEKLNNHFIKSNSDFVGSYIFFKKVDYSGKKIVKIPPLLIQDDSKLTISSDNYHKHIEGSPPLPKPKDMAETIEQTCFQKTPEYAEQSEWRLVVYPLFLNEKGCKGCEDDEIEVSINAKKLQKISNINEN